MSKIMIVDDSSLIRAVLKNFVRSEDREIIEATDGKEAIEKYQAEKPDLTFMDILMPNGMDGLSAVREIKKINSQAKVVMVTSVKEDKELQEATELGVKDYINKPFSKEEITKVLNTYLWGL